MKKAQLAIALGAAFLSSCDVSPVSFATIDANSDGIVTEQEAAAGLPDMTSEKFTAADADGDGGLTEQEFAAAITN